MQNTYHFITNWKVSDSPEVVYRTLEDIDTLARWWPSVYLDVKVLEQGQPGGIGKVVELFTKGWLRSQCTFPTQTYLPSYYYPTSHRHFDKIGLCRTISQESK